jgi:hypothetical protein
MGERVDGKENYAKRELLKLKDIEADIPAKEKVDKNGNEIPPREIDFLWGRKHAEEIIRQLKRAYNHIEHEKESETPINLLRNALEKLNNDDLQDPSSIGIGYLDEAERLSREIRDRAKELEGLFYQYKKDLKNLSGKDNN